MGLLIRSPPLSQTKGNVEFAASFETPKTKEMLN